MLRPKWEKFVSPWRRVSTQGHHSNQTPALKSMKLSQISLSHQCENWHHEQEAMWTRGRKIGTTGLKFVHEQI